MDALTFFSLIARKHEQKHKDTYTHSLYLTHTYARVDSWRDGDRDREVVLTETKTQAPEKKRRHRYRHIDMNGQRQRQPDEKHQAKKNRVSPSIIFSYCVTYTLSGNTKQIVNNKGLRPSTRNSDRGLSGRLKSFHDLAVGYLNPSASTGD